MTDTKIEQLFASVRVSNYWLECPRSLNKMLLAYAPDIVWQSDDQLIPITLINGGQKLEYGAGVGVNWALSACDNWLIQAAAYILEIVSSYNPMSADLDYGTELNQVLIVRASLFAVKSKLDNADAGSTNDDAA